MLQALRRPGSEELQLMSQCPRHGREPLSWHWHPLLGSQVAAPLEQEEPHQLPMRWMAEPSQKVQLVQFQVPPQQAPRPNHVLWQCGCFEHVCKRVGLPFLSSPDTALAGQVPVADSRAPL